MIRTDQSIQSVSYRILSQEEVLQPYQVAIDRPSDAFLCFIQKHYEMKDPVRLLDCCFVFCCSGKLLSSRVTTTRNNFEQIASVSFVCQIAQFKSERRPFVIYFSPNFCNIRFSYTGLMEPKKGNIEISTILTKSHSQVWQSTNFVVFPPFFDDHQPRSNGSERHSFNASFHEFLKHF